MADTLIGTVLAIVGLVMVALTVWACIEMLRPMPSINRDLKSYKRKAEKMRQDYAAVKAAREEILRVFGSDKVSAHLLTFMWDNKHIFDALPTDSARKVYLVEAFNFQHVNEKSDIFVSAYRTAFNVYAPQRLKALSGKGDSANAVPVNASVIDAATTLKVAQHAKQKVSH